nr:nucleotidyltransferase domain-containing protein [Anaerolineae bacterium]
MAVVVYGSHARGTATPGSDIDLLVVVRGLPRDWCKSAIPKLSAPSTIMVLA